MAKKKKQQPIFSPSVMLIALFVLLCLALFGIQVPSVVQDLFGVSLAPTTIQKTSSSSPTSGKNPGPIEKGEATFTQNDLKIQKHGWIVYHALDSLGRATSADALLTKAMINTGTTASKDIRPTGFISGLSPYYHSRGHLIGRQLGGSGDKPENLVTLYQNPVNTPYMTKYENMVRQALETGETIRYRVTVRYQEDALLCQELQIEAKSVSQNGTLNFNIVILNEM